MIIHNTLPLLLECMTRWKRPPTESEFMKELAEPLAVPTHHFFDDYYEVVHEMEWSSYREHVLKLNPKFEETRLNENLAKVESLFEMKLDGEVCLIGSFETMDGFARFDRGRHTVFLGVDESHLNRTYLDVLTVHELTHVARESRPEVWEAFGLNPKMPRADFLEYQPVIEHLMGEGFSCAVSEILVPGLDPWTYVYQSESSLKDVFLGASLLDRTIHQEIRNPNGDYGQLYGLRPTFAHYVWANEWVKRVLCDLHSNDPRKLLVQSSKHFIQDALNFSLDREKIKK